MDGVKHRYEVLGVLPFEEVEDDISTLIVWIWCLKDHIEKQIKVMGRSVDVVRAFVRKQEAIQICADLANREKHGGSSLCPWTNYDPRLDRLRFSVPQAGIASITINATSSVIDVSRPELVRLARDVLADDGRVIGEAIAIAAEALSAWGRFCLEQGIGIRGTESVAQVPIVKDGRRK